MASTFDNKRDEVPGKFSCSEDFTPCCGLGFFSRASGCTDFVTTLVAPGKLATVVSDGEIDVPDVGTASDRDVRALHVT